MSAMLSQIDGIFAVSEASTEASAPCDSGAADHDMVGGTGLSAREVGVVFFMLVAVTWAAIGGFMARGWVDEPLHVSCAARAGLAR